MKKIFILGAFALLTTTVISCTADEVSSDNNSKTELKKEALPEKPSYADGPDDDPIKVPPPPVKD
ncbi:hypothetical protein [Flavobacterium chilense]|uniref:Lipoprotein n=1 Tax=Flavobacterium chilense TaxID=946677 RepID=A0A1M7JRC5_9FLAO|nr:hypothetical protein [Flavobacterium chilense]SHM55538.1 hypothetical protein SAMN05444484_10718 [Flavobacterium chilense]